VAPLTENRHLFVISVKNLGIRVKNGSSVLVGLARG